MIINVGDIVVLTNDRIKLGEIFLTSNYGGKSGKVLRITKEGNINKYHLDTSIYVTEKQVLKVISKKINWRQRLK